MAREWMDNQTAPAEAERWVYEGSVEVQLGGGTVYFVDDAGAFTDWIEAWVSRRLGVGTHQVRIVVERLPEEGEGDRGSG